MLVVVDTQDLFEMIDANKKPLSPDNMFLEVWVYLIKKFIIQCPELQLVDNCIDGTVLKVIVQNNTDNEDVDFEDLK